MQAILTRSLLLLVLVLSLGTACRKIPVGYLDTTYASFPQKEVYAYRTVDADNPHSKTKPYPAPWTSQRIQGVSGTNPVNFEYLGVTVSDGGDAATFSSCVTSGEITVAGGTINVFPSAVDKLPNGRYSVNLRVYNEGYSRELIGLCTFVIQDKEN